MNLPRAILFDLDDTLLDYDGRADETWRRVCARFASEAGLPPGALHAAIHEYADWYWGDASRHRDGRLKLLDARRVIVRTALERLGVNAPSLGDRIADAYSEARRVDLALLPGALETLVSLRTQGIRLALVTNGSAGLQRAKIRRFELEPLFDVILVEGEFGAGKPDERVYRHVLRHLGVAPIDAWMVGDNLEWDVAGAQAVGILGIWVNRAGSGIPEGCSIHPDRVIRSVSELLPSDVRIHSGSEDVV